MLIRRPFSVFLAAGLALFALPSCGYNEIQRNDEQVTAAWSEVLNQYQRRYDLIPNLVKTVQAFADQEREVFTRVTEARSRVGSIQATPELVNDPQAFAKFQQSQAQLSSSLGRLLLVAENYPQLKSDQNFRDLQAQLEGTENRIAVARKRYIDAVRDYNVSIRTFPGVITARIFDFEPKPAFEPDNVDQIKEVPEVDFNTGGDDGK